MAWPFSRRLSLVHVVVVIGIATPAFAQDQDRDQDATPYASMPATSVPQIGQTPAGPPPTPRHTGIRATLKNIVTDFRHVPSRTNLFWAGLGGGLALAVHPLDDNVDAHFSSSTWSRRAFTPGKYLGSPTLVATTAAIYAVGRISDRPKVSHTGMDLIRALALDTVLTQSLKHAIRRDRPDGSDQFSFPSGHASATFAFATALERHLHWRGAVPGFVFASYVASSRLREHRHYLSDVVAGAAVGIIAGRTATRHGRTEYSMIPVPTRGGMAILVARLPG